MNNGRYFSVERIYVLQLFQRSTTGSVADCVAEMLKWFDTFHLLLGAVNRLLFAISADQLLLLTCVMVIAMGFNQPRHIMGRLCVSVYVQPGRGR